jgi:hypothetical protein
MFQDRVASCFVVEPGLNEFLVDRLAFLIGIALLLAKLDYQPHVFDFDQPLLLVIDEFRLVTLKLAAARLSGNPPDLGENKKGLLR